MVCPFCGTLNDTHSPLSDASQPYKGAASLCAYCCRFGIFDTKYAGKDGELYIRTPNDQEQNELDNDADAQQALKLAQGMMFLAALRGST